MQQCCDNNVVYSRFFNYFCSLMKLVALFLSILLFTLNYIPCKDVVSSEKNTQDNIEFAGSHSSDKHGDDDCSPLCVCNCCSVPSIPSTPINIVAHVVPNKIKHVIGYNEQLLDISLPIWQPPQLLN